MNLALLQVSAGPRGLEGHGGDLGLPGRVSSVVVLHSLVAAIQSLGGQLPSRVLDLQGLGSPDPANLRKEGRSGQAAKGYSQPPGGPR